MTKPSARAKPLAEATKQRGRLAAAQADVAEIKAAKLRGSLVEAAAVEAAWSGVLRTVRAGMLAVPSRVSQRLPHLTAHDVAEIDSRSQGGADRGRRRLTHVYYPKHPQNGAFWSKNLAQCALTNMEPCNINLM